MVLLSYRSQSGGNEAPGLNGAFRGTAGQTLPLQQRLKFCLRASFDIGIQLQGLLEAWLGLPCAYILGYQVHTEPQTPSVPHSCAAVVYGSCNTGQYEFEWAALNETKCLVNTFDCLWNGTSQGPRHKYYKWCVGDAKHGSDFRSWANITATLGHSKVDVMKIDIGEAGKRTAVGDLNKVLSCQVIAAQEISERETVHFGAGHRCWLFATNLSVRGILDSKG